MKYRIITYVRTRQHRRQTLSSRRIIRKQKVYAQAALRSYEAAEKKRRGVVRAAEHHGEGASKAAEIPYRDTMPVSMREKFMP